MKRNSTTETDLPPTNVGVWENNVSGSFERFCLTAGIEALGAMTEKETAVVHRRRLKGALQGDPAHLWAPHCHSTSKVADNTNSRRIDQLSMATHQLPPASRCG
jgi:hypothetical protein